MNETCKEYLKAMRKVLNAKPEEKIDKRYKSSFGSFRWLAPNDKYYKAHCGYCAEVNYLQEIYNVRDL